MSIRSGLSVCIALTTLVCGPLFADGLDEVSQASDATLTDRLLARAGFRDLNKSYALVVGVSEFDEFSDLPTVKDPVRVRDFLINEAGFDYVHLLTGDKVTKDRLEELMLDDFRTRVGDTDRFLFYWSGHGETLENGDSTRGFLPLQSSKKNRFSSMVSMEDIGDWDSYINAHQVLYLLDSCFSGLVGSAPQSDLADITREQLSGPSRHVITAGRGDEQTIAVDQLGGSVFTHALLKGLRGAADTQNALGKDSIISVGELKGYLGQEISRLSNRFRWENSITPQIRDLVGSDGAFFFPISDAFPIDGGDDPEPINRISEVQETLKLLGYDPGPVTGSLSFKTAAALISFQRNMGLDETGKIDEPTLSAFPRAIADFAQPMGGDERPASGAIDRASDNLPEPSQGGQEQVVSTGPATEIVSRKFCETCPEMVVVGEFADGGYGARPFYISTTEVTVEQFQNYVTETGLEFVDAKTSQGASCFAWQDNSKLRKTALAFNQPFENLEPNHPVSCVSRDDAQGYIDWLNETNEGPKYRLPSQMEYFSLLFDQLNSLEQKYPNIPKDIPQEYAQIVCKFGNFGDSTTEFPWRNKWCSDGQSGVAKVGTFEPDTNGIYDLAGNLWEWVSDCALASKSSDVCSKGLVAGGSFDDPLENATSLEPQPAPVDRRQTNIGFRIARDL